jgi:hypothetical protein
MGLSGNLKTMDLSELLQWAASGQKTGCLALDSGSIRKQLFFQGGTIIACTSTSPREQIGNLLVSRRLISETELDHAVAVQQGSSSKLGEILTTLGLISQEDLDTTLLAQAEEILYDVFLWSEADFRFSDGEEPAILPIELAIDVTIATFHGMRRVEEWRRVKAAIPSFDAVPIWLQEPAREDLDELEQLVLALVDDVRTVHEVCLAAHATDFEVGRVLLRQIEAGKLKPIPVRNSGALNFGSAATRYQATDLLNAASIQIEAGDLTVALRHVRAAACLDPETQTTRDRVAELEDELLRALRHGGLDPHGVLTLRSSREHLNAAGLSPEAQFIAARIDGKRTIAELTKALPLPEVEALLIFQRLLNEGHLMLEGSASRVEGS